MSGRPAVPSLDSRGWLGFGLVTVQVLGVGLWLVLLAEMASSIFVPLVSLAVRRRPGIVDLALLVVAIAGIGTYEYLRQAHRLMQYAECVKGQWGED